MYQAILSCNCRTTYVGLPGPRNITSADKTGETIPSGNATIFIPHEKLILINNLIVTEPNREERHYGVFNAIATRIASQMSLDATLQINLVANDILLMKTLEKLGFDLVDVLYDLMKDGPDRDKVLLDDYVRFIHTSRETDRVG